MFSPSRIHRFVEYQFYAGTHLSDDEWVFSGYSFTDTLWMGLDGKLREGPVDTAQQGTCGRLVTFTV